jgi:hypothetical protein
MASHIQKDNGEMMENTNKIFQTPFFPFTLSPLTIPLSSRTIEQKRILTAGKKVTQKRRRQPAKTNTK